MAILKGFLIGLYFVAIIVNVFQIGNSFEYSKGRYATDLAFGMLTILALMN